MPVQPAPSSTPREDLAHGGGYTHREGLAPSEGLAHREGLAHDARNLLGAMSLYCDLLAQPRVLRPEHRHYADELRLVSSRSLAMISRLVNANSTVADDIASGDGIADAEATQRSNQPRGEFGLLHETDAPVSLRQIAGQCSGLLGRIAGDARVLLTYGIAAAVPVQVDREHVERILVNLVRNAASAVARRDPGCPPALPIRIEIGAVPGSFKDDPANKAARSAPVPWPLGRVRLTVVDSGCGMSQERVNQLSANQPGGSSQAAGSRHHSSFLPAPANDGHGIGLRIVRELVESSGGTMRISSELGTGTQVSIDWPMAPARRVADADPDCDSASQGGYRFGPVNTKTSVSTTSGNTTRGNMTRGRIRQVVSC